jgi:catechol 2,3-dioxygenase-like lactoylglutathione lyase family enzyme
MGVLLDHTIVHVRDSRASATFLAEILGLPPPEPFLHFLVVRTANGVSLDFLSTEEPFLVEHYAFLVSEPEFDQIFGRIEARNLPFWADPAGRRPGEINRNDGGRGLYFREPSGHILEILTVPYGGR